MRNRRKRTGILLLGILLLPLCFTGCRKNQKVYESIEELNHQNITVATWNGAATENALKAALPEAKMINLDTISVLIATLRGNKIDAVFTSKVFFDTFPDKAGLKTFECDIEEGGYGYFFAQTDKGKKLRDEMNEFIKKAETSGLYEELERLWLGEEVIGRPIGTGSEDPDAPELIFAVEYESPPFGYMENNQCLGYDTDFAECFCKEYGYRLKVVGLPFSMIASGDMNGEYDFAGGALQIDEELKQSRVISDPHYSTPYVLVVRDTAEKEKLFSSLKEGIYRTLITENRWKMYVSGLFSTLFITVISALAGTLLGFIIYLIDINSGKVFRKIANGIFTVVDITPVVVLLMIFYHIIFKGLNVSGRNISTVVFTLIITSIVYKLMSASVNTIDQGQREAAIALGCTPTQAFFRVVMPQAMRHFIPIYKGELISLIKLTSVVGYIAVQDLTKTSDIIRSRTFDAFFPLFIAAVIYIVLALLMIALVNLIFRKTDPKARSQEKILAGLVERKEAAE